MFTPIEQSAWPAAGEARELRFSLNAPVLFGPDETPRATRAALGWLPAGSSAVVRLWLRPDGAPQAVRGFDLPDPPLGPAARARALEAAERFLAGLGFLFPSRTPDPDPEPDPGTAVRADVRLTRLRHRGPRAV